MPRRRPRSSSGAHPLRVSSSAQRVEPGPDGSAHVVRAVPAARAEKTYRCPGCDHQIRPGTAHLVTWPAEGIGVGLDDRRHWHTGCWTHRDSRGPTRRWS
ncbi:hypothetical protein H7J07_01470 [Mycobacterium koreense]|uniref:Uncharacterized protein n=1 Tax=Mycolicibacillus koreensis TaxID=1069220 RepID=A0A7I7S9N9_9MYCO|nr:hypothetical protein [Mycolicibacillus koreensis]MCV7246928.1 hypothetical protein [Mycolicibacillus koreensis]OSC31427.1 hypothetical protein B8W67_16445 [Mycolicibacillus koreensis]BBY53602.1 hypothetical protein MKOR_08530 [Mycolicibacillus koreensis]